VVARIVSSRQLDITNNVRLNIYLYKNLECISHQILLQIKVVHTTKAL